VPCDVQLTVVLSGPPIGSNSSGHALDIAAFTVQLFFPSPLSIFRHCVWVIFFATTFTNVYCAVFRSPSYQRSVGKAFCKNASLPIFYHRSNKYFNWLRALVVFCSRPCCSKSVFSLFSSSPLYTVSGVSMKSAPKSKLTFTSFVSCEGRCRGVRAS
jgi:hypothetical protein